MTRVYWPAVREQASLHEVDEKLNYSLAGCRLVIAPYGGGGVSISWDLTWPGAPTLMHHEISASIPSGGRGQSGPTSTTDWRRHLNAPASNTEISPTDWSCPVSLSPLETPSGGK